MLEDSVLFSVHQKLSASVLSRSHVSLLKHIQIMLFFSPSLKRRVCASKAELCIHGSLSVTLKTLRLQADLILFTADYFNANYLN